MPLRKMLAWAIAAAILLAVGFGAGAYAVRRYSSWLEDGVRNAFDRTTEAAYFYWSKGEGSYQQRGRELYDTHCSVCHGADGQDGRAPDLTGTRTRSADALHLASIIRQGIAGTEMPAFEALLSYRQSFQIAAHLLDPRSTQTETAATGDPAMGASLVREKGNCLQCHMVAAEGIALGPDLTNIGRSRSPDYLRRKLQRPAEAVAKAYRPVEVIDKHGATVRGFRQNEDTFSIQVRGLNGQLHSFWKQDVMKIGEMANESFMPSYEEVFSEAELDDVVAYLASLGT